MSERDDIRSQDLLPEQEGAASAVASLGPVAARAAFRARLRAGFVAGTLASPTTRRVGPSRLTWLAPLAAAAVLLAMLTLRGTAPLRWDVVAVDARQVVVDGRAIALQGTEDLQAVLTGGRTVQVPAGGRVELLSPGRMFLQLNGGVEVDLPRYEGEVFASRVGGAGTLRVATGPRFVGSRYRVLTDSAELEITGTTFTVINGHGDTCICVLEGTVQACARGQREMEPIAAGGRMTFHDFGRQVGRGRMLPGEEEELSRIRARYDQLFSQP